MKTMFNLLCRDIAMQVQFYGTLLNLAEIVDLRSPIYRALAIGDTIIGFNGEAAYELLAIENRQPSAKTDAPVTAYATFILDTPTEVDTVSSKVANLGGSIVKPPYRTYYGHWQAVLLDPEHHVFRVSALLL
jgi:predicted enzyme related to lactoylglutathione lyase